MTLESMDLATESKRGWAGTRNGQKKCVIKISSHATAHTVRVSAYRCPTSSGSGAGKLIIMCSINCSQHFGYGLWLGQRFATLVALVHDDSIWVMTMAWMKWNKKQKRNRIVRCNRLCGIPASAIRTQFGYLFGIMVDLYVDCNPIDDCRYKLPSAHRSYMHIKLRRTDAGRKNESWHRHRHCQINSQTHIEVLID